jgi:radical SAM protein with 4Fe4S-binding SPASM domain
MKTYSQLNKERIDLSKAIPLKKPFTILFEPASTCNFRCIYCYYGKPDFHMEKGLMGLEDFKNIADDLAAWEGDKIKVIRLIGFGEPFLNKNTPKMVEYLKQLDIAERIEITSNCSLLTPTISQQLIDAELDYLRCSIYGASQKRHAEITRSKITLESILFNILDLMCLRGSKEKPFVYVKMLANGIEENNNFIELFENIVDEVALEPPHKWLEESLRPTIYRLQHPPDSICPQPFKMLSIRYDGDVIVCDPDWQNNTKVGNALEDSIKDIWNGENLKAFWKMQLEHRRFENESCKYCSFVNNDFYIKDEL